MRWHAMPQRRSDRITRELDWNLLFTFTVIVEEGSITRAAERLFLRQPTISNALKRLEAQVGRRLIDRRRTGIALTEHGRTLYEEAREITARISQIGERLSGASEHVTGHITIALASHVTFAPFDAVLARFHERYPQVTFSIDVMTSEHVARAVSEREATFGVSLVHRKLRRLTYLFMCREHFGFFCGPRHRLFGKRGLTLDDLRDETFVSFHTDRLTDALRPVALLRARAHIEDRIVAASSHLEEVRRMIVAGMGIGPLPIHVVQRDVDAGMLWQLPPYDDPPAIDLYVLSNPAMRHTRAERLFLDDLTADLGALAPRDRIVPASLAGDGEAVRSLVGDR